MIRYARAKNPRHRLILSLLALSAIGLMAGACTAPPAAEAQQEKSSLQNPTLTPTVAISPTPNPESKLPADSCVACHQDKGQLIQTAAEESVVEAESSGEG